MASPLEEDGKVREGTVERYLHLDEAIPIFYMCWGDERRKSGTETAAMAMGVAVPEG